jgi:hypothetical protein
MRSLIKGHGRQKRLGNTGLDSVGSSISHGPLDGGLALCVVIVS